MIVLDECMHNTMKGMSNVLNSSLCVLTFIACVYAVVGKFYRQRRG